MLSDRMSHSVVLLLIAVAVIPLSGCKSKEEKACLAQEQWAASLARALGDEPEPLTKQQLAECVAEQQREQAELGLDDEQYQALLDCKIAAKDMNEGLDCLTAAVQVQFDEFGKQVQGHLDGLALDSDAVIVKLAAHVESGAVSAETIALLRNPPRHVPVGRIPDVAGDALGLIEAGRVDAAHPVSIRLHPGLGADDEPFIGLDGAELSFVDPQSGATVGRLARIDRPLFGSKSKQVAALFEWMLEDPASRRVELIVSSVVDDGGFRFPPPDALYDARPRFEEAGIADRPVIWLDGEPLTLAQWAAGR